VKGAIAPILSEFERQSGDLSLGYKAFWECSDRLGEGQNFHVTGMISGWPGMVSTDMA